MAPRFDKVCGRCRLAGEKLFLKGEKCNTPKCPLVRRPYPPGNAAARRGEGGGRRISEYGRQLREKQALRAMYGVSERQLKRYYRMAMRGREGAPGDRLADLLEARLDNVVYRAGWALSRAQARQFVAHGLIAVNGRRVTIPSFQVRKGMLVAVRENKRQLAPFVGVEKRLEKTKLPAWLERAGKDLLSVRVVETPAVPPEEVGVDLQAVVEFYAR